MISEKSRVQAVAAKISAARELARRLAEEKQAAVAAAKADADSDRLKRSTEEAAAQAAAQVCMVDMQQGCSQLILSGGFGTAYTSGFVAAAAALQSVHWTLQCLAVKQLTDQGRAATCIAESLLMTLLAHVPHI
jgi:hypothetical protein